MDLVGAAAVEAARRGAGGGDRGAGRGGARAAGRRPPAGRDDLRGILGVVRKMRKLRKLCDEDYTELKRTTNAYIKRKSRKFFGPEDEQKNFYRKFDYDRTRRCAVSYILARAEVHIACSHWLIC